MSHADALRDYSSSEFTAGPWTRAVYRRGSGPAVIVMHEMPGPHPLVVRFADRVAAAGMTAVLPILFGEPGRPVTSGYAVKEMLQGICIRREFSVWAADRSSPIVDWLRALSKQMHQECGGPGVGAIGMCFTGGFALAMMTEPAVIAPVLAQPSLPLPMGPFAARRRAGIGVSPAEIACAKARMQNEDLTLLGLRFFGDPFVPDERFATYREHFGKRFEAIELDPKDAAQVGGMAPHSVLTVHLKDDDPTGPTKAAERRVLQFFGERLLATNDCLRRPE